MPLISFHKEALCYPCALRMSVLFQLPSPPSLSQLLAMPSHAGEASLPQTHLPILDDHFHSRYTIVHELATSVERYFEGLRPDSATEKRDGGDGTNISTSASGVSVRTVDTSVHHDVTWLCVACQGLYQFMDLIIAPYTAAVVRCTPYYDAKAITVNVNVGRSFTFTWLAAATRYFDVKGTMLAQPDPLRVIPEELSSFKDFYMSDLRARILLYLKDTHESVIGRSPLLPGLATYLREIARLQSREAPGLSGEPPLKTARAEEGEITRMPSAMTDHHSCSRLCAQGFSYSATNESVVVEVCCRHSPTEVLISEERIPAQYCRNRSNCVLNFAVIYDHVLPQLERMGMVPSAVRDTRSERREAATVINHVTHANIYLIGQYRKLSRTLSQTPWFANGVRVGSFSLQEIVAQPALNFFFPDGVISNQGPSEGLRASERAPRGREGGRPYCQGSARQEVDPHLLSVDNVFGFGAYKFHSAGREDVDVRMLGNGRPFVLELISPTREAYSKDDLAYIQKAINESFGGVVEVSDLRPTGSDITVRLARHSESKIKHYRCVVWCSRPITRPAEDDFFVRTNKIRDLVIEQKTPLRVLHRRSLHTRERVIHSITLTPLNEHWFIMDLSTQAGTYVKEFVHGDFGRTTPNLGMLLNGRTDIIQLDVVWMAMQDLEALALNPETNS